MAECIIRTGKAEIARIRCGRRLQQFAMRWSYVVRRRHRWAHDADASRRQAVRLRRELAELGVTAGMLKRVRGLVEVSVPDSPGDRDWEARILPWEFVLATATKPERAGEFLLLARHLRTGRRRRTRLPKRYAVVETAPGQLASRVDVAAARDVVAAGLAPLAPVNESVVTNPTGDQLRAELAARAPDIIHLAGVDNRHGRELLGRESAGVRDGILLADAAGQPQEYRAERIAQWLNHGRPNPLLVGFQCWDSAARLAPMTIHQGTQAAIAFQHTVDAAVAETFFLNFYRRYTASGWDLLAAFTAGWESVARFRARLRGSSITLWTADSLVGEAAAAGPAPSHASAGPADGARRSATPRAADPGRDRIEDLLRVSIRPKPMLNYSALHNGGSPFDEFALKLNPRHFRLDGNRAPVGARDEADAPGHDGGPAISRLDGLEIEVQLHVGTDSFPYRSRVALHGGSYRYDLASGRNDVTPFSADDPDRIQLPLTGELFRTISEPVQTSLYVTLRWFDQVLYRHTHAVWIAPIDQWTLEERQLGWLPSFIQPRDPAVAQAVRAAHRYLKCLADAPGAGFGGYQAYDSFASGIRRWDGVDRQVRALWSALLLDHPLGYINPPPSYAEFSQRVRPPHVTLRGGFGTCVDLSVLLASCLEWVEIHPVLFLLDGHVFPGYWKDLEAHRQFLDVVTQDLPEGGGEGEAEDSSCEFPWVSGARSYREIKGYVDRGQLVPIESVSLTRGAGFRGAVGAGREHFHKNHNRAFRAMIDVVSARQGNGVTPLPTLDETTASG